MEARSRADVVSARVGPALSAYQPLTKYLFRR